MPNNNNKEFNPFAFNIIRLQRYNFKLFTLEEIVFFEYIVIKSKSFEFKEFYHSHKTISDETGIKKHKLNSIITKFEGLGIYRTVVRGFPLVTHFTINFAQIIEMLPTIYQLSENGKLYAEKEQLLSYFGKLLADSKQEKEHKKGTLQELKNKPNDKKGKDTNLEKFHFSISQTMIFLEKLEQYYNERRQYKNPKTYPPTKLGYKKEISNLANIAYNQLGKDFIEDAFLVFTDKIIAGEIQTKKVFPYFFKYEKESFDVINAMADIHAILYTFTKPK